MTTPTRLPDEAPALRVVPMPADSNAYGDVFGGWIMSQVDIAGSVPAHRRARGRVATVAVTNFVFKQPVSVGDLVSFYARVLRTGRSSIVVDVEVYAERRVDGRAKAVKVTEAELVYVAIDASGQPMPLPPELAEGETD
ncbi:MAG TPA: acyl-CoA thioesterase [Burkholderiaceae bacterium]|jgi:acyl-CoA thioesterase YciA|nr:acyl-CoA thioesterase [Burkholderiaceae bacterium]HPE02094.1 acyl-CoA thioesterase [Burkholderiaceae bacterium]HRZ00447.1 acyl-CoA thioesterase [Burkholderiaceae bacterium]